MNDNLVLCVGDIHLGVNKNNPQFFKTALRYADWIAAICEKKNIKTIVQLGDIFHNREMIHLPTMNCAYKFFDKLKKYKIHIIVGNHDALYNSVSDVNSLKLLNEWPNITIHEKVTKINNMAFCGWGTKLEDIPESDIIFGHFDIKGFQMSSIKISEHGFSASDLMSKCKLLMSGHYHKPQVRLYNGKPLVYTGSAYQLNWGESGESKYAYILNTETLEYKPVENKISPRFEYINDEKDFEKAKNNFVSVEVQNVEDVTGIVSKFKALNAIDVKTIYKPVSYKNEDSFEKEIDNLSEQTTTISDCIKEYVDLLENVNDCEKDILIKRLDEMYSKCI